MVRAVRMIWSNMVLSPSGSSTVAQRQAIGALCADAGVSVNMDYNMSGSGESGAYMEDVQGALVNTFGYANAICGEINGTTTIGAGLNGMVNPNLDAGCPVLFGINDGSSGHAIVCDGYGYNLSTLYHHLNLGWSGSYTAWYNLPTIDADGYTFNSVDSCIYNVWTNGTGEIISGRVTDGDWDSHRGGCGDSHAFRRRDVHGDERHQRNLRPGKNPRLFHVHREREQNRLCLHEPDRHHGPVHGLFGYFWKSMGG